MHGLPPNFHQLRATRNNRCFSRLSDLDKPRTASGKLATKKRKQAGPRRQRGSIGVVSSRDFGTAENPRCYSRAFEILMAVKRFQGLFDRRKEENRQKRKDVSRQKKLQEKLREELEKLSETQQFLRQVK